LRFPDAEDEIDCREVLQNYHKRVAVERTKARLADSYPEGPQKRMYRPQESRARCFLLRQGSAGGGPGWDGVRRGRGHSDDLSKSDWYLELSNDREELLRI
jgi:hypothetical protein